MPKRRDLSFLKDIKEAISRIKKYIGNLTYDQFINDYKTQDAIVRNLQVIGEAVKNISDELKKEYPDTNWKELAGLRDRLIHQYFGVNYDIVWAIIKEELSIIDETITYIIKNKFKNK